MTWVMVVEKPENAASQDSKLESELAAAKQQLRETEERFESLLIVGHEPFCSRVVGELCGGASVRFKPACIARVDLAVRDWSDVAHDRGELRWLVTPKMFSHGGFEFADAMDADI